MVRIFLLFAATLTACSPSPKEAAMPSSNPAAGGNAQGSSEARPAEQASATSTSPDINAGDPDRAALGPSAEPVSAAENPLPSGLVDSPAEARGRRILSTGFVMVGPDGRLTVELRNGRVLVLRDVVMRAKDYCGVQVSGGKAGGQFCGGYADVAAARPGAVPPPESRS